MAGEDDLVSQVSVEGTEAAAAKLDAYAAQGSAAFDKLNKSAQKSSQGINSANKNIEQSSGGALASLRQFAAIRIGQAAATDLGAIERASGQLTSAMRKGIPAIATFITRLAGVGAAAAAGGAALLKAAENVAKGNQNQETAADKAAAAQTRVNDSALQGQVAQINLASSQRQLFAQFQKGEITFSDYSTALKKLNADYKEQQRVTRETERVTESMRLENERIKKQAQDTNAFQKQIDLFGGPLLTSLRALGNQAGTLFTEMKNAFGPVVAQAIDLISNALSTNGASISAFFNDASKKATEFLTKNGPAIQLALTNIGSAIKQVFDGVINALPGFLDFFNNQIVPAIKSFGTLLNDVANVINGLFGTKLTGGAVAFIAILGSVTGAFKALFAAIRIIFSLGSLVAALPFGPVLLAIGAAIALLLIAFPGLRQAALDLFNSFMQVFNGMLEGAKTAGTGIITAFNTVLSWFTSFFPNLAIIFKAGWDAIVAGVTGAIELVKTAWNATTDFFTKLGEGIKAIFVAMWDGITNAFNTAIEKVKSWFNSLLADAKAKLQPILDLLKAIAALASSVGGGGTDSPVTAAGGGHIRGKGTSTSDSIPAWLSDNEFVIRAKSVSKYGVGLLNAINSGRFKMPKFNMGGLVSSMIAPAPRLAFADGGEVHNPASMRPLNLNLFGEQFNGLLAPEDVGERLGKYAVSKGTRSAGRKPGWVGRGRR